jgi:hypothetical protein
LPPAPPTDPDVRISRIRFVTSPSGNAVRRSRCCYPRPLRSPAAGAQSPRRFPDRGSTTLCPFPPRGPRGTSSPASAVLRGAATACLPGAALGCLAWRYHRVRLSFRSPRPRRQTGGLELVVRSPAGIIPLERPRLSQVPGQPLCSYARVFDPGGTDTPGHDGVSARPPA